MGISGKFAAAAAMAMALSACGSPPADKTAGDSTGATPAAGESSAAATTADAKPAAFAQCAVCHSTEKGKNLVGPSLFGVVGRKAGTEAGFAFSDANKNSGLTWDEKTLDTYLANPMKMVPGTKMTFAGLTDAAQRKEVIDYLKTLK